MNITALIRALVPRPIRIWLRAPAKSFRYLRDQFLFRLGRTTTAHVRPDWRPLCHPTAREHFEVFHWDPIQSSELDAFIQHCPAGIQLLDLGAHYGFFALAALHYGGLQARVICVEASSSASAILMANVQVNRCTDRVRLMNIAVGDSDGELAMLTTGPHGGDYFVFSSEQRSDTVLVKQRSLTSILAETGFRPTHIKMDIESFEFEVIQSGLATLRELHPILFLELHGTPLVARGKQPMEVIRMLRNAGYTRFTLGEKELTEEMMAAADFNCRMICW